MAEEKKHHLLLDGKPLCQAKEQNMMIEQELWNARFEHRITQIPRCRYPNMILALAAAIALQHVFPNRKVEVKEGDCPGA